MTLSLFATGIALGIIVSVPPGPNAALCVNLASGGVRRAIPFITGAALADAAYSLLAASGILIASQASSDALALLAPCSRLQPPSSASASPRSSARTCKGCWLRR